METQTTAEDRTSNSSVDKGNVQHVNKKSSDELLRKFANTDEDEVEVRTSKRRKRSSRQRVRRPSELSESCGSPNVCGSSSLVERRSLLPSAASRRRSVLLRRLGIRARGSDDLRNRSLLGAIEKTWRKTVEGASRVFMEKHYNRHKRLISDLAL